MHQEVECLIRNLGATGGVSELSAEAAADLVAQLSRAGGPQMLLDALAALPKV